MARKNLRPQDHTAIQSRLAEILPTIEHPLQRQLLNLGQSYLSHGQFRKAQAALWSASEQTSQTSALRGELQQMAREVRG
jgi:uncharacterized protein HemY